MEENIFPEKMDYIRHYINKQDVEGLNTEISKWGITFEMCHHALTHASKLGYLFFVKYFVALGANVRFQDDYPVLLAAKHGHLEVVKYLVSLGANVRTNNDAAFQRVCEDGNMEMVMYLYEAGADIHLYESHAITCASYRGHLDVVFYLYERGADISRIHKDDKKYIVFREKMKNKIKERAQKKIYFWWIPICYDTNRDCGKRMMMKNLEKAKELGLF